uniref:DB domain-containing protein n=1 Tax=Parastrongyloides trichosuri TaxID=131310 RepID=A0A0N4ZVW1_PARTI
MKFLFFFSILVTFNILSLEGKKTARQKLKSCCAFFKDADKFCMKEYCDFNFYSRERIIQVVRDCKDKGKTLEQLWTCAANKHDHTKCCAKSGVPSICHPYCTANKGPPRSGAAELLCLGFMDQIRKCFRVHLEHHEIFTSQDKDN